MLSSPLTTKRNIRGSAEIEELREDLRAARAELARLRGREAEANAASAWPAAASARFDDDSKPPWLDAWATRGQRAWDYLLMVIVCNIIFYSGANRVLDAILGRKERVGDDEIDVWPLVHLLPLAGLAVYDARWNRSKRFLPIPDAVMNYVLRVLGGYGIVQVLAQDLGLKTGVNQRNLVQHPVVQFFLLWGGAYSVTSFRSEGMVSALLYFVLKYNVSGGRLADVCFEQV